MQILELVQNEPSFVLLILLVGAMFGVPASHILGMGWSVTTEQKLDAVTKSVRTALEHIAQTLEQVEKLVDWHRPESTDGGATQRFGWKFTNGEIRSLEEMPKEIRAQHETSRLIVAELKGLRADIRELVRRLPS